MVDLTLLLATLSVVTGLVTSFMYEGQSHLSQRYISRHVGIRSLDDLALQILPRTLSKSQSTPGSPKTNLTVPPLQRSRSAPLNPSSADSKRERAQSSSPSPSPSSSSGNFQSSKDLQRSPTQDWRPNAQRQTSLSEMRLANGVLRYDTAPIPVPFSRTSHNTMDRLYGRRPSHPAVPSSPSESTGSGSSSGLGQFGVSWSQDIIDWRVLPEMNTEIG